MTAGEKFINQEIPLNDRFLFPKQIQAAYDAVAELIDSTPFLKCPPAKMAQGHLRAWAVDFAMSQLIESGQWKVDYDWAWFEKPTGKYLRIFTKGSVVTINQIQSTSDQPRQADFRDNAAYDNQPQLFLLPGEKNLSGVGKPHLILLHGYHDLQFIHVAMPNPQKQPTWLGITKNLLTEIHDASAELTPTVGPETITVPTIKEAIKKKIKDHGI